MHAKFNLKITAMNNLLQEINHYVVDGRKIHEDNKEKIKTDLKKFENAEGNLQAEEIIENWFPSIKADVFLSHAHLDERLTLGLAGWLNVNFGIKSFIDSTVWGHAYELQKLIDDKYNKIPNKDLYDYEKVLHSSSHVRMMLSTALMDMIDKCECIIFVNTPQSFRPSEYLTENGETGSPWIYSEIAMTRMLRQKPISKHRLKSINDSALASTNYAEESRDLHISYPLELFDLTSLSCNDLEEWKKISYQPNSNLIRSKPYHALDCLYEMKREREKKSGIYRGW